MHNAESSGISPFVTPSELHIAEMMDRWGLAAGLSEEQGLRLWHDSQELYSDLAYHNFHHAKETVWEAMRLADWYDSNRTDGQPLLNRKALLAAPLLHDAGYHHDTRSYRLRSKEKYSAAIFVSLAPRYGLGDHDITVGAQAIRATQRGVKPLSLEDKILVRADLGNVSGNYETSFMRKTALLRLEEVQAQHRLGQAFDTIKFLSTSIIVLSDYLSNDLSLGDFDTEWSKYAQINLWRLAEEMAAMTQMSGPTEFLKSLGSSAVTKVLSDRFKQ